MLDSLQSDIHLSSSLTQTWLLHAVQRGDLMRILEPLLLILLHPDTARLEERLVLSLTFEFKVL